MSKVKPLNESHTVIECVDCGRERTVRNQDKHQVIRCKECQAKYRLSRRNELRAKVTDQ